MNLCRRDIPIAAARDLLARGRTLVIGGFISKKGKPFSASLILRDGKVEFDFAEKQEGNSK
jgi:DNA topoisomerase-3